MRIKLVFIGGAPGVGKSTVAEHLLNSLEKCVWLDADDLWNMHPFVVDESMKAMVERNIHYVLNSFFRENFTYILFTWVLHLDSIIDSILSGLDQVDFDFKHITLICDEKALLDRISNDMGRSTDPSLAIKRLRETYNVQSVKIDTDNKTPSQIASIIKNMLV